MRIVRLLVAASLALSVPAFGQVPPDIAANTRSMGQSMDPASGAPYAALFPPSAWDGVTVERDLAYGQDALQKLDVYRPDTDGAARPVILFVHGGGFTRGDKHGAFYPDNIPLWAAKEGMIGVTINYRLAPDNPYPAAGDDLRDALAWVYQNIARYGGDPKRVILFGHSAGANHVADHFGNPDFAVPDAPPVAGIVLLSPNYPVVPAAAGSHPYYGTDTVLNSTGRVIERLGKSTEVPIFLADAEFDPDMMQATAAALREGLCKIQGRCPTYVHLANHNHFTEGMALGTSDRSLGGPLLDWIAALPEAAGP